MCNLSKYSKAIFNKDSTFLRFTSVNDRYQLMTCNKQRAPRRHKCFKAYLCRARGVICRRRSILSLFITRVFDRNRANRDCARAHSQEFIRLTMCRHGFKGGTKIFRFSPRVIPFANAFTSTTRCKTTKIFYHRIVSRFLSGGNLACAHATRRPSLATFYVQDSRISSFSTNFGGFNYQELIFGNQYQAVGEPMIKYQCFYVIVISNLSRCIRGASRTSITSQYYGDATNVCYFRSTCRTVNKARHGNTSCTIAWILRNFASGVCQGDTFFVFSVGYIVSNEGFLVIKGDSVSSDTRSLCSLTCLSLLFVYRRRTFLLGRVGPICSETTTPPAVSRVSLIAYT